MKVLITLLCIVFYFDGFSQKLDTVYTGIASYYHSKFDGRLTASGERFSNDSLTAAHKTWVFGTIVKIINITNNEFVVVRINDRLPQNSKRTIDITQKAAFDIGIIKKGLQKVELRIIPAVKKPIQNSVLEGEPFRITEHEKDRNSDSLLIKKD